MRMDVGTGSRLAALLRLSAPIMVAQGGLVALGITDTFMIGRVSAVEMGGVALGNAITIVFLVFGLGLTMGIEPLVSQATGAGERHRAYGWFVQGLWAALLSSPPVMLLTLGLIPLLSHLGVPETTVGATVPYIWFRLPSIPVNAMYGAARSYLTSIQRTRPVVVAVVAANVANIGLDYVFLFVLDMGAAGIGLATTVCWVLMFGIATAAAVSEAPADGTMRGASSYRPDGSRLLRILRLGWPIGLQLVVEVGIFALVGLLVARMGEVALGGHQIAMTLASFTFMAAVGIAVGATTLVGFHIGAGHSGEARRQGFLAVETAAVFMGLAGVVFLFFGTPLARLFAPNDDGVVRAGAELLKIAALFSISDGVQAVSAGALRGVGDTKWPFYANLAGHWLIGLPLGLVCTHWFDLGARGLWFGLTAGLTAVAITLTVRFYLLTRGEIVRVE